MSCHSYTFFPQSVLQTNCTKPSGDVVKELKCRFLLATLIHRTVFIKMRLEAYMLDQYPNDSYEYQDLKAMGFSIFI